MVCDTDREESRLFVVVYNLFIVTLVHDQEVIFLFHVFCMCFNELPG